MDRKEIIFVDMEGTLFQKTPIPVQGRISPSAWNAIAHSLGESARRESEEGMARWNRGEFADHIAWMEYAIRSYQKHDLRRETFEQILAMIDYHPGVIETFQIFRQRYRTALISGGFRAQADRAQSDLQIDDCFAACELLWNGQGQLERWNLLPCDYEGKVDFMHLIMKKHGANPDQCIFIGDGINDIPLAQTVGTSIAFNGHPELQKVCTHVINQSQGREDFRAVLNHILTDTSS